MADDRLFQLEIITPDRIFFDGETDMVELSTSEGIVGIYKEHIPMTSIIAPGILKIHQNGEIKTAALHSGFIEILQKKVTILAETVEWPGEIDIQRAEEARIRAERRLKEGGTEVNTVRAELALRRSLARMQVAEKKGM